MERFIVRLLVYFLVFVYFCLHRNLFEFIFTGIRAKAAFSHSNSLTASGSFHRMAPGVLRFRNSPLGKNCLNIQQKRLLVWSNDSYCQNYPFTSKPVSSSFYLSQVKFLLRLRWIKLYLCLNREKGRLL